MSANDRDPRKDRLRTRALELGFVEFGVTSSRDLACGEVLFSWIAAGRHGRMDYLERQLDRRIRPRSVLATTRSVVVCAYPCPPGPRSDPAWPSRLTGQIAAYALGADYHDAMAERLARLCESLLAEGATNCRAHVDSGPLVEKELARRAGLGWYGRNTNLLTLQRGSNLLLGCLLTDLELTPDEPFDGERCGTCRACVPACPTGALDSGRTIDARRCIAYLTIELRGPLPRSLRPLMGNWVFGCDDCQTPCPWNDASSRTSAFLRPSLVKTLELCEDAFAAIYGGTAVARAKRRGLARNAAVALGNSGNPDAVAPLERALRTDPDALVRAHAAWALGRIGGPEAARFLGMADLRSQSDPVVAEIRAARNVVDRAGDDRRGLLALRDRDSMDET